MRLLLLVAIAMFMSTNLSASEDKISRQRKLEDERIERDFADGLRWVDKHLDKDKTFVRSYNGYVLLFGSTDNQDLVTRAQEHANRLENVRQVFNQLHIGEPEPDWFNQQILNGKIRSHLLTAVEFDSSKVRFESYFGTVYLMGLVTANEAEDIVDLVAGISGVDEIVTLFEYVQ